MSTATTLLGSDDKIYSWDEDTTVWVEIEGQWLL